MKTVKVGVIGCGNISPIYLKSGPKFEIIEIVAVADQIRERAESRAEEFGVPRVCTVVELLADPEIEIVINITTPNAHAEVGFQVLEAGKCVYNEKPLAIKREDGKGMVALAKEKGVLIGGAPDTFLGGGIQTCRKLIEDGWIGEPVAATAFMLGHGHESWHPDPEFYYYVGGGPMFDMGPYYLTALVNLMGPVRRATGSARITFAERTITSEKKYGNKIQVEVPTHIASVLDFANGAVGTLVTSFDVWGAHVPRIEIYGSTGSLSVPDPNTFGGPVSLLRAGSREWQEVPLAYGYAENSRGLGVADMAHALRSGRKHRANGDLTYHVLDVMHAIHDASNQDAHVMLESTCEQPALFPLGMLPGVLDD